MVLIMIKICDTREIVQDRPARKEEKRSIICRGCQNRNYDELLKLYVELLAFSKEDVMATYPESHSDIVAL